MKKQEIKTVLCHDEAVAGFSIENDNLITIGKDNKVKVY